MDDFKVQLEAVARARAAADATEAAVVRRALAAANGNVRQAAKLLGVTRGWLDGVLRGRLAFAAPAATLPRGRPQDPTGEGV